MFNHLKKRAFAHLEANYKNWDVTIAMRYQPILDLINSRFTPESKILEIGPGELGILPYLDSRYHITGLDVDFGNASQKNRMHMVKIKNEKFPFPDNAFDLVFSLDTLEHIPQASRDTTIAEALRVSKKVVFFGFPTGIAGRIADWILAKYYKITHGHEFPYLSEHQKYGLPITKDVVNQFKRSSSNLKKKVAIDSYSNTNVFVWILLLLLGFSQVKVLTFAYRLLNYCIPILSYLNFWPSYRSMVYVDIKSSKN